MEVLLLFATDFIQFRLTDVIDILLVAFILFELYAVLKGTTAMKIFWGIVLLFVLYKLASFFHLSLMSAFMGQVISVGVLALIVLFQSEIRSFLLYIGNRGFLKKISSRLQQRDSKGEYESDIEAVTRACMRMSLSKTGALIVMVRDAPLNEILQTGEKIDSRVSRELIENIFFKNSPLHDGAVVIKEHRIAAARCILPVSKTDGLPSDLGLRHRSAIGVTTMTDALAIVVSEQTGQISLCKEGTLTRDISPIVLKQQLQAELLNANEEKKVKQLEVRI
ncbi:MAG: diadenylate cyclase CdaA [Bacteroidales bacterium]|nr:diadenylate cyclase CdaA [Bacteroidales bacterium]